MRILLAVALAGTAGCVRTSDIYTEDLPAEGVLDVFADSDRGDFAYSGAAGDVTMFEVEASVWGRGGSEKGATKRADTSDWGSQVTEGLLDIWSRSPERRSGVDFSVVGPPVVNVEAVLLDGTATVSDVEGFHLVTANRVVGDGIVGDVDFYAARDGIDIEVFPWEGGTVLIQSFGDVVLLLPYGMEYDLEIFADFEWGYEVAELGFDSLFLGADYVSGFTGAGKTRVEVIATGGTVYLWEAIP